tara:strand:- start:260 stop:3490 length:3231 start_codon:yes stop_codon:yes gene_type:complete
MASITQKISNYIQGISEQPDELKAPGQVNDLKNAVPDIVYGCIKRPGSHLVKDITTTSNPYGDSKTYAVDTGSHCKWFPIYTDNDVQYIGQVSNAGVVNVWRCSDGASIPVDYASITGTNKVNYLDNSSLSDEKSSDIQPLTINETTFFCNRRKNVAMLTGASDKSPPSIHEAYIALDTISYGKQYAFDLYDPAVNTSYTYNRATSIGIDEDVSTSNITSYSDDGKCEGMTKEVCPPSGSGTNAFTNTGTVIHATSPPNQSAAGKANLRYEVDVRCQGIPDPSDNDTDDATEYVDSYQTFAKLQFGGEGWSTNDTHTFRNTKGLETTVKITNHITVTSRANIAMVRPEPTSSNNEEHVSAAGILGDMKATLDAISGTGITATIVGNGIHLYKASSFGVSTTEQQLMNIATSEVNDIADLPRTCRHGYTVRVANSGDDQDDYYLRFQVEGVPVELSQTGTYARSGTTVTITAASHGLVNGDQVIADFTSGAASDGMYTIANVTTNTFTITDAVSGTISAGETVYFTPFRFGEGVWEECAQPGINIKFDKDTMPVKLTFVDAGTYAINGGSSRNYTNGVFKFDYPAWSDRDAGDDITNPTPSFVGYPIQKMVFFRNRIALLSAENIILSRVNDFYNFWAKTAMTISNVDPIDLQSSSTYPTKLYDAVEANTGLVLFSASQQFLLSSGAEALMTPETAKISYLASYAFNSDTNPFSMGTTVGFLNSTAKNTRFYEIANINTQQQPTVVEQSKVISKKLPTNVTLSAESTENDTLLFGVDSSLHAATNEVWGYRFFDQGERREQAAWFRWEMPNPIIYHVIMDDVYYAIMKPSSQNKYTLERFDLKVDDNTLLIGASPDDNRIHLDTKKTIASGDMTYNTSADTTTFTLGSGYYSSKTLTAYCATDSDLAGKSEDIPSSAITGTAPNETVTLNGNWKTSTEAGPSTSSVNTDLIIGYEYEYEVQLPTVYVTRTEGQKTRATTRGSLTLHRMNFNFGDVGVIDVTLKRRGRSDYTKSYESIEWDSIKSSTTTIADTYIHTIPVYDRNENLTVHIKSNHPSPATLFSMNWEGDYSNKYYKRV